MFAKKYALLVNYNNKNQAIYIYIQLKARDDNFNFHICAISYWSKNCTSMRKEKKLLVMNEKF